MTNFNPKPGKNFYVGKESQPQLSYHVKNIDQKKRIVCSYHLRTTAVKFIFFDTTQNSITCAIFDIC